MYYTNVFLPWFDCLVTVFYLCLSFFVFLQRKHVGGLKTEIVFLQRKHVGGLKTEIEVAPFFLQTSDFFALTPWQNLEVLGPHLNIFHVDLPKTTDVARRLLDILGFWMDEAAVGNYKNLVTFV